MGTWRVGIEMKRSEARIRFAQLRQSHAWETVRNVAVALMAVAVFWSTIHPAEPIGMAVQYGLAAAAIGGVVICRRAPWVGVLVSILATAVAGALGLTFDPFTLAGIALFTVAEHQGSRRFPKAMVLGLSALFLVLLTLGVDGIEDRVRSGILGIAVLAASWVLGTRTRQVRIEVAARSRDEERLRLVREIHDVLTHTLGMIGVRAGASAQAQSLDESALRSVLAEIEEAARSGMSELKVLIGRERSGESDRPLADGVDVWSLGSALASVMEAARSTGMRMWLETSVDLEGLPASVATTVYRLVQESVTNAVRHAQATDVWIVIAVHADRIEVTVSDNGQGRAPLLCEGNGLIGMRERVHLLEGTLTVADRDGGGLAVVASLPVPALTSVGGVL